MLSELRLRNFKAFGDKEQKAPMSKITLIYGPNSGGKSSVIQALLLLKQSLFDERPNEDRRELMSRGEDVDLGGFPAMIHKHETNRELGIGVTFIPPRRGFVTEHVKSSTKYSVNLILGSTEDSSFLSKVAYQILDGNEVILDAKLEYDPDKNLWDRSHLSIANMDFSREKFPRIQSSTFFYPFSFLPELDIPGLDQMSEDLLQKLVKTPEQTEKLVKEYIPEIQKRLEFALQQEEDVEEPLNRKQILELILKQIKGLLRKTTPEQIAKLSHTHKYIPISYDFLLRSITHMGPLRNYPERFYTVSGGRRASAGVRGEYTPHILYHNANTMQKVNEWFGHFDIPYKLEVSEFGDETLAGKYVSIALSDKNTKTPVTLADVGFGINQLLPIITEGLTREKNAIICVEQPEIHLHPRLQANIADLMIETSKGKEEKQWIVETHSELLIRRIQRHIREETLNPNDVSVIYVNPGDEGSKIEVLELDEDGDFTDEWPHGFFDEGFNELMGE